MTGGTVTAAFLALSTAAVGMITSAVGWTLAASTDLGPWAQVGGTGVAVSALVYVAKLMADGKLVALPVADIIKAAEDRERRLIDQVEDGKQREDALRALLFSVRGRHE